MLNAALQIQNGSSIGAIFEKLVEIDRIFSVSLVERRNDN